MINYVNLINDLVKCILFHVDYEIGKNLLNLTNFDKENNSSLLNLVLSR